MSKIDLDTLVKAGSLLSTAVTLLGGKDSDLSDLNEKVKADVEAAKTKVETKVEDIKSDIKAKLAEIHEKISGDDDSADGDDE